MKIENTFRESIKGCGRIAATKSEVRVTSGDRVYTFAREYIKPEIPLVTGQDVYFEISWDGQRLFKVAPWTGIHPAEYAGIPHRKDEEPAPITFEPGIRTRSDGTRFPSPGGKAFNMEFEISGGPFEGARVRRMLDYNFADDDGSGEAKLRGDSIGNKKLYTTLAACGLDLNETSIPYSENVLPQLDKLLAKKKAPVQLVFEDGKVKMVEQQLNAVKPKRKAKK